MSTLITLPLEILFRVFDFITDPFDPCSFPQHPLNSLAATSKYFDSACEEYARALLKQHANFAPQKKSKTYTSRRKWLAETCQFCYRKSKRRSTLWTTLTCCLACDKKHFAKVTMTNAIKLYSLSKLDIFTPNRLHPTLPPLAHGEYSVMGGIATMIYEPDLALRQHHIHGLLKPSEGVEAQLRKRVRRHDALIAHMEISYSTARKFWHPAPRLQRERDQKSGRASMETKESRDQFVQKGIAFERATMGVKGASEDTAIELD